MGTITVDNTRLPVMPNKKFSNESKLWDQYFNESVKKKVKPRQTKQELTKTSTYDLYLNDSGLEIYGQSYDSVKKFNKIIKNTEKMNLKKCYKIQLEQTGFIKNRRFPKKNVE